jgi:disulfide oxidoreductase YuzD
MLVAFGLISIAAFGFFAIAIIIMTTWFKGKVYYHQLKAEHVSTKKFHYSQYHGLKQAMQIKAEVEKYEKELKASNNKTKTILKSLEGLLSGTFTKKSLKLIEKRINDLNNELTNFINRQYPNKLIKILDNQILPQDQKSKQIQNLYNQIAHNHARLKHEIESTLNYLNNLLNTSNVNLPKSRYLITVLESNIKNRFNAITVEINKVIEYTNQQLKINLQIFDIIK